MFVSVGVMFHSLVPNSQIIRWLSVADQSVRVVQETNVYFPENRTQLI